MKINGIVDLEVDLKEEDIISAAIEIIEDTTGITREFYIKDDGSIYWYNTSTHVPKEEVIIEEPSEESKKILEVLDFLEELKFKV